MSILNKFTSLGFAALMAAGTAMPSFAADKLVITLDTPPGHVRTRMIRKFTSLVEERSKGEMKFEIFDSNQLFSSRDATKAVVRGDAGMTILVTPYLSRVVSDYNVFDLPMLNGLSADKRAALLDGELGANLTAQTEAKMKLVIPGQYWSMGKVWLWSTAKPMKQFSDLKGMQVRIPGGAALVMRLDAIGASAVSMPGSDVPLALQQGTVDATMSGPDYIYNNKFWDAGVKHGFWDGGIIGFLAPLVNKDYWTNLSKSEQTLFTDTWNEITVLQRKTVIAEEAEFLTKLGENGITISSASKADVVAANKTMMAVQPAMIKKLKISPEVVKMVTSKIK